MTDNKRLMRNVLYGFLGREPAPGEVDKYAGMMANGMGILEITDLLIKEVDSSVRKSPGTKTFVSPGHFYSPIVDVNSIVETWFKDSKKKAVPGIDINDSGQLALWNEIVGYLQERNIPEEPTAGWRYHFRNPAFSYGDGSVLHGMLRHLRPKRIIEIGSGFSSACTLDTLDRFLPEGTHIDFIEPYPKLLIKLIGAECRHSYLIHEKPVQEVNLELFDTLSAGDILFIDSTHVMKTGSDVCCELFNILPRLAKGVYIHFHDIFWPFEYGRKWVMEENRSWNEVYGLRAFLMYNEKFQIRLFNDYMVNHHRELIAKQYPELLKNSGGSIWLEKVA